MEISKELQDFLNDDHVLDLISVGDYKTLFSMLLPTVLLMLNSLTREFYQ